MIDFIFIRTEQLRINNSNPYSWDNIERKHDVLLLAIEEYYSMYDKVGGMMVEEIYQRLIQLIESYHPANSYEMVEKAYKLAASAHQDQYRKSGEPYIIHPLEVACILAELELDLESITAGILHDVIEDTVYTYEEIAELFGKEVAELVDGVTKLTQTEITYTTDKEEIQVENYRKMFLAMAKDIRVILIKLADRLHNMRTLKYMPESNQMKKAREVLDIYAPLANRLGISKIKAELEDLALKYLEKDAYKELSQKISRKRDERFDYINNIVTAIQTQLKDVGIDAKVEGRPKHFFSIYKKMVNQHKTLDQIYDLFAVRAIVDSVKDCYGALGVIHDLFTPIPGRFKDYIAMPKPNMYQSLHTTLMGPEGQPFEVQIRTLEMHRASEYGIAAHWKYKEGKSGKRTAQNEEEKLAWLRQILEWQIEMSDNKEFMDAIKLDLDIFNDSVYAFTPRGDVVDMPKGSTPIDFAYHIHSAVGNKMVGARVNGKIVTFDYRIKNGDRIEIITSQNSKGPSRDWLTIVKSSQAKNKINQWYRQHFKEENIERGKDLFDKYAKGKGVQPNEIMRSEWIEKVLRKFGFREMDAIFAAIGHGGLKEGQVVNRLIEELHKTAEYRVTDEEVMEQMTDTKAPVPEKKKSKSGITVRGIHDVAVRFSRCCNPVPGDEIIGYVTRGRGVSIHRTDCVNIIHCSGDERERLIDAEWESPDIEEQTGRLYQTEIQVISDDRQGIIIDISSILKDAKIPVRYLNARTTKDGVAYFNITVEINGKAQLEKISDKIKMIPGVRDIIRTSS